MARTTRTTRTVPTTPAERKALASEKALATRIAKLRADGVKWDGDGGICSMKGMPKSAIRGRTLLRKHGLDSTGTGKAKRSLIAPSYERTPEFRAAESARRAEPVKPAPKKRSGKAKPAARKRTARAS